MLAQTRMPSSCRSRRSLVAAAIGAAALVVSGCAELEVGAHAYKTLAQTPGAPSGQPAPAPSSPQNSTDPALYPDRAAFYATGLAQWDGTASLPGVWVAHPMAGNARRVRLTNGETGAQADAALLRRDPNFPGATIIVSSEAAEALGLKPGRATPLTIEALTRQPPPAAPGALSGTSATSSAARDSAGATLQVAPLADAAPASAASAPPPVTEGIVPDKAPTASEALGRDPETVSNGAAPQLAAPSPGQKTGGEITDGRNFIQAGVFGQAGNAARLAADLRAANLPAVERQTTRGDRVLTRVLIGPFDTVAERDAALDVVRSLGPADAIPARG